MKNVSSRIRDACIVSGVALAGFSAPVAAQSYFGGISLEAGASSSRTNIIRVQRDKGGSGVGAIGKAGGGASAGGGRGGNGESAGNPGRGSVGVNRASPSGERAQRGDGGGRDRAGRDIDRRGDRNRTERGPDKVRTAEDRGRGGKENKAAERVRAGNERGNRDRRGGRDRAERGNRWGGGFGKRGRRYRHEKRAGFYFWAPWIGQYAYYDDYDSCYAASYSRCLSAGFGKPYCKGYVRDLCAW